MPLTDAKIRSTKVSSKRIQLKDGKVAGLYLRVQPSGVRSWVLSYRPQGSQRARTLSLGRYPEKSIAAARRGALDARAEVRTGGDPRAIVAEKKRAERLGRGKRFNELAGDYLRAAGPQLPDRDGEGLARNPGPPRAPSRELHRAKGVGDHARPCSALSRPGRRPRTELASSDGRTHCSEARAGVL